MWAKKNAVMVNRLDQDSDHFDDFANRLDALLSEYSARLTIGELISTLTVTQHSLISQGIASLNEAEDASEDDS